MKRKLPLFTLIFLIIAAIVIIIIIIFSTNNTLSPISASLEKCNTLVDNGKSATNIVFLSDKQTAEEYSGYLMNSSPFNNYQNSFNFYYIDSFQPSCELYKGIAVFCYNSDNMKKASSCPNDIIIVAKEYESNIRASSYMNMLSLNTALPKAVVLHEFAHAFANLADEYIPSEVPKSSKNCPTRCDSFGDKKDGCFEGCSETTRFRSIDAGIMRTLSTTQFGIFDEQLISDKIIKKQGGITGQAIDNPPSCTSKYILIDGNYIGNQIIVNSKSTETGCLGTNGAGGFTYNLVKTDNSIMSTGEFNPELIFTDNLAGGQAIPSDRPFMLKVPFIDNSKSLKILKDNSKISEINLLDVDSRPCRI